MFGRRLQGQRGETSQTGANNRISGGIRVARWARMRPLFLAWLTLALILLALGRFHAGDEIAVAGFINATDQEAADGYFTVGGDTLVVVKQGSGLQRWLKIHSGQNVRLTLEPAGLEH
jgi:hypothetical protein